MSMAALGEILAELREDHHLSQRQLAEIMNVTPGTVSNYETGRYSPSLQTLSWFADYYEVTTDYLLGRSESSLPLSIINQELSNGETVGNFAILLSSLHGHSRELAYDFLHMLQLYDAINTRSQMKEGTEE